MEITKNQLIGVVLALLFIWVYFTWDDKENFDGIQMPPKYWGDRTSRKWGEQTYYNNDRVFHPAVPSIVNYDDANYKLPASSLKMLEQQYKKQLKAHQESQPEANALPVPHNIHSGQTEQVAGTENINQAGAPLHEVLQQELNMMQPLHELRQQAMGQQEMHPEMESQHSSQESVLQELKPNIVAESRHEIRPEMEVRQELHSQMEVIPEARFNLGQEIKPEVVPELHPEFLPEMKPRQIPQEEQHQSQNIAASLMPGMIQKAELEEKQLNDSAFVIKIRKPRDRNLTIAILLTLLLVGFIYYTKDY
ncbi:hypothetical protein QKU48_gp0389 [Fadolivirus algeromassiliense]|jgi:hypothetical protein|uniref:Uncharacterized protein n=1 Tax=Fadolivirus FV1/VV64 TaxID=3070911 RepID=A0A7D3QU36_9VIRU|nr:hypothetical protein QKU48_gp0389 [Fadolivirus algeromassiliense]QKF93847.1 hypothetical protein Fadolivirus_1_389 [Fadolivirus FV1/VV64]